MTNAAQAASLEAHARRKPEPSRPNHGRDRCRRAARRLVDRPIDQAVYASTKSGANEWKQHDGAKAGALAVYRTDHQGTGTADPQAKERAVPRVIADLDSAHSRFVEGPFVTSEPPSRFDLDLGVRQRRQASSGLPSVCVSNDEILPDAQGRAKLRE